MQNKQKKLKNHEPTFEQPLSNEEWRINGGRRWSCASMCLYVTRKDNKEKEKLKCQNEAQDIKERKNEIWEEEEVVMFLYLCCKKRTLHCGVAVLRKQKVVCAVLCEKGDQMSECEKGEQGYCESESTVFWDEMWCTNLILPGLKKI